MTQQFAKTPTPRANLDVEAPAPVDLTREICRAALGAASAEALIESVVATVTSVLGDCACRIALRDANSATNTLRAASAGWVDAQLGGLRLEDGHDPINVGMETQTACANADLLANPDQARHAASALLGRWRAYSVAPFEGAGVVGAIALYRRRADAEFGGDLDRLASLAPALMLAVARLRGAPAERNMDDALNKLSGAIPGVVYQRVVFPDGDVRYTFISESAREFFGVEPERILNDPQALFQHYDPDYRKSFREKLLEASRNLTMWDVEASIRLPNGSTRTTHAIARPERRSDGSVLWTGVILDASRIKEAERLAAEAEARTRANILESLSQGLLLFDANDRLIAANSHFYELYPEYVDQVVIGSSYRDFAQLEYDLAGVSSRQEGGDAMPPEQRLRRREEGKLVSERRYSEDRWLMVSEHRTPDHSTVVIFTDVSELKQRERRINHLAYHDALTGLPNRSTFRQRLDETIRRCARLGRKVGVMCVDLDRFKFVNDTLGHPAGDELLIQVSNRLRSVIRETDTAARLGGDEFAIILEMTSANYAHDLATRLLKALGRPYQLGDNAFVTTGSIGIAVVDSALALSGEAIVKRADIALYRAKAEGRDRFRFFEEEMGEAAQERRQLEIDLRMATERDQLVVNYQPLVDAQSHEVRGVEALVRWNHPTRGLIGPADFIVIAEETGLISKIGEWVLRQACQDAMLWPESVRVAVNVSPAQFRDSLLPQLVQDCLQQSGLNPKRLELEVTESLLLGDTAENLAILSKIHELGVRVVMDDFGTGYSSLANLRSFPFDKIKIDRGFVQDIDGRRTSSAIVRAVLSLARGLGMSTTAEGVETDRQLEFLCSEGCAEIQGFLFSRPLPAADIADFVRNQASSSAA